MEGELLAPVPSNKMYIIVIPPGPNSNLLKFTTEPTSITPEVSEEGVVLVPSPTTCALLLHFLVLTVVCKRYPLKPLQFYTSSQ